MGQVKRHSYVGTHTKRANFPVTYQNYTPSNSKKSGVLGGYCERVRGLKKEYCQIDPTRGEGGPDFSSALAQHNDDNPRY